MILTLILRHQPQADADALDGVYLARVRARVALHGLLVTQVHIRTRAALAVYREHRIAE